MEFGLRERKLHPVASHKLNEVLAMSYQSILRSNLLRFRFLATTCSVCGCMVIAGCDLSSLGSADLLQAENPEPTRLRVNVARAEASQEVFERSISFGTIKPSRSSSLGFARGGRVAKVYYNIGDYVAEGETIAELEQNDLVEQLEKVNQSLADAQSLLSTYQSRNNRQQVARVQQDIESLNVQQKELRRELDKGLILAPYRAQLAESNATVGDMVPSGRPLFRINEDVPPIVEVNLPSAQASNTSIGEEVWIKKNGELWPATVESKSPEVDPSSRTQLMKLGLPDSETEAETEGSIDWTFGEVVEVHFWTATERSGFWLPYSALQREANGLWSTYVIEGEGENQTLGRRIVEIVQLESDYALVQGSLAPDDLYLVDGLNRAVPGQRVNAELVQRKFTQMNPPRMGE